MKIVSLVPSITEALFDFGLTADEVIGRTKFCIHPEGKVKDVPVIGGTKNLNLDRIITLNPDLIIANKEENEKQQVTELMKSHNVWLTDIETLQDNSDFINDLGELLNKQRLAEEYNQKINEIFRNISISTTRKVAYLIWKNPYMTVGGDTFISKVLAQLGFVNIFENQQRYPEISVSDLQKADCVFLSSEPFPFKENHLQELQLQLPHTKIFLVDGEAFSWYGTHLAKCEKYFEDLLQSV